MEKRNYGIDLLRICSMLMVLILHLLGAGGILASTDTLSLNYNGAWFLETATYCAVNCYGLISGYVGWKSKPKYANIVLLWLQVVLYSAGVTLLFSLIQPGSITGTQILQSFFPVINNYGWYFTCYFALFFFMPALNHLIGTMTEKDLKILCGCTVGTLSILSTAALKDIFQIKDGYSVLWLAALYLFGGCIGRFGWFKNTKKRYFTLIYFGCVVLSWGVKCLLELWKNPWLSQFTYSEVFIRYKSPTILLSAVVLLLMFSKINLPKIGKNIVKFLSPTAFGVYIIHMHPQIWNRIIVGKFAIFATDNLFLLIVKVLLTALILYLIFSLIDLLRHYLFRWLKIKEKLVLLEQWIQTRKKETI